MAITISTTISKKIPDPHTQYANHQASITITAEITDLNHVQTEAARLYLIGEQAVDRQLGLALATEPPMASHPPAPAPVADIKPSPRQPQAGGQTRPYPRSGARRAPAPATDSQLRFLDRLIAQTGTSVDAVCSAHQVGSLADLSCKAAAGVIDELKSRVAA